MNLVRKIADVKDLSLKQKNEMFSLMQNHYANTVRSVFENDLSEKDWVLMLSDESTGKTVGFSTQILFPFSYKNKEIKVLFSGDTVIHKEYWGSMGLILIFSELMVKLFTEYKNQELYWMLISKGIRTYKYLPFFFNEYYPSCDKPIPDEIRELMNLLGKLKFPGLYDKSKGVVKAKSNAGYLKENYHPKVNLTNKHDAFFYNSNPGYIKGDELLCLTQLSLNNIKPYLKKMVLTRI